MSSPAPAPIPRVGYNPGERVIEAQNVDVTYGEVQVVFGVSLHVDKGELVGLVGGNGGGRSCVRAAGIGNGGLDHRRRLRPRSG